MRIILDTNVLVRANPRTSPQGLARDLIEVITTGPHALILSAAILTEVARVLTYPHVQARWALSEESIEQVPGIPRSRCRDRRNAANFLQP